MKHFFNQREFFYLSNQAFYRKYLASGNFFAKRVWVLYKKILRISGPKIESQKQLFLRPRLTNKRSFLTTRLHGSSRKAI
jgi:hypothetical protein